MQKGGKPKRVLNKIALEKNGITYHDDRFQAGDLNGYLAIHHPQAAIVAQGLLERVNILSQSSFVSNSISAGLP
jgi:hypothetical protein